MFAAACADDDDDVQLQPAPAIDAGGVVDAPLDAAELDDGGIRNNAQIAHVLITANTGEIDEGTLADLKGTSPAVLAFGQRMVTEHSAANQRAEALVQSLGITPVDNPVSVQLKQDADAAIAQLQALEGAAFDLAYMDTQVTVHTKVLSIIDTMLIPAATAPELTAELQTMRANVATHLQDAQQLRAAVADGGVGDAGDAGDAGADADADAGYGTTN
jgi:putative membrane protein